MSRPVKIADKGQKVLDELRQGACTDGIEELTARLLASTGEPWERWDTSAGLREAKELLGYGTIVVQGGGRAGGAYIGLEEDPVIVAGYVDGVGRGIRSRIGTMEATIVQATDTAVRTGENVLVIKGYGALGNWAVAARAAVQSGLDHLDVVQTFVKTGAAAP